LQRPLDGVPLLEALGPGAGPDPGAVLGDPADRHQVAVDQHRKHLGQEILQFRLVLDSEVVEHVIVDRDRAAEPAVGFALQAEPRQFAATGDSLRRGIEPKRDEQLGVGGRPPRPFAAGADRGLEPGQIPGLDQVPDEAGVVVVCEEFVERAGAHQHLPAVGPPQPRGRLGTEVDRGPFRRLGVSLEVRK